MTALQPSSRRRRTRSASLSRSVPWLLGVACLLGLILVIELAMAPSGLEATGVSAKPRPVGGTGTGNAAGTGTGRGSSPALKVTANQVTTLSHGRALIIGACGVGLLMVCGLLFVTYRAEAAQVSRMGDRLDQLSAELGDAQRRSAARQPIPALGGGRADDGAAAERKALVMQYIRLLDKTHDGTVVAQLSQALERVGVQRIEPAAGDRFDDTQHQAVSLRGTGDPARVDTIAAVVRPGYRDRAGMIREAEVQVYAFE